MGTYYVTKESQEIAGCQAGSDTASVADGGRFLGSPTIARQWSGWWNVATPWSWTPSIWRMWCRIFYGNRGNRCERLRVEVRKMEEKREGSRSLSQQEEDALQSIARSDLGGLFKARMDEALPSPCQRQLLCHPWLHPRPAGAGDAWAGGGAGAPEDVAWVSEHLRPRQKTRGPSL